MDVLIVGGGGREHAIAKKLSESRRVGRLRCAPGNGGIAEICECVPIKAIDIDAIVSFAKKERIGFVVVAPDDPLALGLVDRLEAAGITAFGPTKAAAEIESSKAFSKKLMSDYGIPTADYRTFSDSDEAIDYIREKGAPIVVKADGLALGKGVSVCPDIEAAEKAVLDMMDGRVFGASGARVVIEDMLEGPEVTVLCFTDGETVVPMPSSQDHKRAFDKNLGPNTGGMGAVSPVPAYTEDIARECMEKIFIPTIRAMKQEGRTFRGVLYFGLMLTKNGPKVIEYNARFGDPEAQAVLSLLETDLLSIFEAVCEGTLGNLDIKWTPGASCGVVLASGGYPGAYETGKKIEGIESAGRMSGTFVYHAGTCRSSGGCLTSGGRVLCVTSTGKSLGEAIKKAYAAADMIYFDGMFRRNDIGNAF